MSASLSSIEKAIVSKKYSRYLGIVLTCLCYTCNHKEMISSTANEDQFSMNIRTTEAQSPAKERSGFKLPPGFEIQLFASEPQIGKPINMSFDAKGRMWVTQSYEYPFADSTGAGKDKITILEDTDGDGKADLITDFADSLNIPIGVLPVKGGAIAYSIPNVYYFLDKDGDDRVDERKVILSGFEYKDTHGMINNFFRGLDGWIHGSHGFANNSSVTDRNGKILVMSSGNTFRFKEDGSDVEFTTIGRVNPFGYAYDEMGYLYSVDCHTSPIYQLIRGADYPHFGKKPTGIGFGPSVEIKNQRGATALAGLEYYIASQFPSQYQNSFYYGDVVKSKVYRSTKEMKGTTPYITQEEDFIVSEDPWFRPVDVKTGPDGALYIADFYNRIIGHYEVPLDHPGRDRERGRIWRIIYIGDEEHEESSDKDWSEASLDQLIEGLGQDNLTLRTIIADQIIDRFPRNSIESLNLAFINGSNSKQQIQVLWLLYRLNASSEDLLIRASESTDVTLRVHALRIMFEYKDLNEKLMDIAKENIAEAQPDIVRAAIMVLSKHPETDHLQSLLSIRQKVPEYDTHLKYVIRQCLRNHLRNDEIFEVVLNRDWNSLQLKALIDVAKGVESKLSARFLLSYLKSCETIDSGDLLTLSTHISRYIAIKDLDDLVSKAKALSGNDLDLQFNVYKVISEGLDRRGVHENVAARNWAISLTHTFLNQSRAPNAQWITIPMEESIYTKNPWHFQHMPSAEGLAATNVLTSDVKQICMIRSPEFSIPETLSFQLIGGKRMAESPTPNLNLIQLRLSETDEIVKETYITHHNFREMISWYNPSILGEKGYLKLIDGSSDQSESIGIGQIYPDVIALPSISPATLAERQVFAINVAKKFHIKSLNNRLEKLLLSEKSDIYVKAAAAQTLLSFDKQNLSLVEKILLDQNTIPFLTMSIINAAGTIKNEKANTILRKAFDSRHYAVHKEIALALVQSNPGIDQLLEAAANLEVAPRILLERRVNEGLVNSASKGQLDKYEELTKNIKKPDEEIQELIDQRLENFHLSKKSVSAGNEVFVSNCSPCHQIKGVGGSIGPQLDGIGSWGLRALVEKTIDPNRNISKAFVNYNIQLKDGTSQTGLFRREEGQLLIFANIAGQEFSVSKSEILEKKALPYTLMPDHFAEVIAEEDFYALLNFLLNEN